MLIAARALLGVAGATLMPSTHGADPQHVPRPASRCGAAIGDLVRLLHGRHDARPAGRRRAARALLVGLGVPARRAGHGAAAGGRARSLLPEYRDAHGRPARPGQRRRCRWPRSCRSSTASRSWPARASAAPRRGRRRRSGSRSASLFVRRQRRLANPLLDLRLFANRAFSAALGDHAARRHRDGRHLADDRPSTCRPSRACRRCAAGLWLVPQNIAMIVGSLAAPRWRSASGRRT